MKKALAVYEQHPDFIHRAYDIAKPLLPPSGGDREGGSDLMCQTLTSLANIAWTKEDYRQALDYAHQAESLVGHASQRDNSLDHASLRDNSLGHASLRDNSLGHTSLRDNPLGQASQRDNSLGQASQRDNPLATAELRQGALQVLARNYLSLNMLDSAETVYRQIEPGDDVHLAYIVQSNLAKIALRRMGATKVEDDVDEALCLPLHRQGSHLQPPRPAHQHLAEGSEHRQRKEGLC